MKEPVRCSQLWLKGRAELSMVLDATVSGRRQQWTCIFSSGWPVCIAALGFFFFFFSFFLSSSIPPTLEIIQECNNEMSIKFTKNKDQTVLRTEFCGTCTRKLQFSSVQSLSHVWLFETPWAAAHQASLSITTSWSLLNSCPLSRLCHPTISSSVVPFSSHFNLSQHQGLFKWVSSSKQVAKVLKFQLQHQSFQWIFRTDFL